MLVLSRNVGDRIVIDENIEVTVVRIRGNRVSLGVTAPRHVSVNRLDLRKRTHESHPEQPSGSPGPQHTRDSNSTNSQNGGSIIRT